VNRDQKEALIRLGGGKIRFRCPMAPYTTFKVGGTIEALMGAQEIDELLAVVPFFRKEGIPYFVVGRGSNLLVMDGDTEGVAIRLEGAFARFEEHVDEQVIISGAGVPLTELLDLCRRKGYGGAEFLAGIPGTVGGAAVMNAGAFERDMASLVQGVEMVTPAGDLVEMERKDLSFGYRKLRIEDGTIVTRVRLKVEESTAPQVGARIGDYLKKRKKTQPLEYPSAGSIFKNPPGDHAGRLIETAGLKGTRRGGAMISAKHANWIVNTGGASARDILALIRLTRDIVSEKMGVDLELEIRVVGQ